MKLPCLFNFSASHRGGGLKRLQEYALWCDRHGGAAFIIHQDCSALLSQAPANRYFFRTSSSLGRLVDDWSYIDPIIAELGRPALYYAYGIPVYRRVGRVNWFHLSNVMPFNIGRTRQPPLDYVKLPILAWRYQRNLNHADVVSAESKASLDFLRVDDPGKLFISVNGSDDELTRLGKPTAGRVDNIAVVVGTYKYKAIDETYRVFQTLKTKAPDLRLLIIGVAEQVPDYIRQAPDVECKGLLPRAEVVAYLERAAFYISTTKIENSYNAASEGVFLARESYVSDIPPHRELLSDQGEMVRFPGIPNPLIRVQRQKITGAALKSWDQVIREMLHRADISIG